MLRRKPKPRNEAYETFAQTHACPWCWACGRRSSDRPSWWGAPSFEPEKAHVCNKPRKEDIRVIVLLCPVCHRASHGDHFRQWKLPMLTTANLIWLKQERDHDNLDLAFLQKCSVRILPDPEPLPDIYRAEYAMRHDRAFIESIRDEIHARGEETRTTDPLPPKLPGELDKDYLTRLAATRGKGAM